jgi:hypothetical protein
VIISVGLLIAANFGIDQGRNSALPAAVAPLEIVTLPDEERGAEAFKAGE